MGIITGRGGGDGGGPMFCFFTLMAICRHGNRGEVKSADKSRVMRVSNFLQVFLCCECNEMKCVWGCECFFSLLTLKPSIISQILNYL